MSDQEVAAFESNAVFPTADHREQFEGKCRMLGVATITVEFSGSGDSGNWEDPQFHDAAGENINARVADVQIPWPTEGAKFDQKALEWKPTEHVELLTLREITAMMCDNALNATGLDWYNNEGGQGSVIFKFPPAGMTVELDVGINIAQVDHHSFEY